MIISSTKFLKKRKMQTIKDDRSLAHAIRTMENDRRSELDLLKRHFDYTIESLNPINIIKEKFTNTVSSFSDTVSSPSFKSKALKFAIGLASGFLTKKLVMGPSGGIIKNLLGTALQATVSGFIIKKMPDITK